MTTAHATEKEIAWLSAEELAAAYRTGTLSPVAVTEILLARIDRLNLTLNAFLFVDHDGALAAARAAAERLRRGEARGPLDGVPVTIKDLLDVQGLPTTS
ncbi:MAG: amidase, partial [Chloroflexota bacterium]